MKAINITQAMALSTLLLDREVSRLEIAEILEMSSQNANKQKSKPLSPERIKKIEDKLGIVFPVDIKNPLNCSPTLVDKYEIKYWGIGLPCEEKLKNPLVDSMWFDKQVINDGWQRCEKDLNIIAMPGDKMDGGSYPLKNGDILVIDTSQTDISISGVYFYTTDNNEEVFVNNFRKTPFGDIVIGFANSKYEDYVVSKEKLEIAEINIVGRVFKNLFLTI